MKARIHPEYLDVCRSKRNSAEYDRVGVVSDAEAIELVEFARKLRKDVLDWLRKNHPTLSS